jgi:hypothetical protein
MKQMAVRERQRVMSSAVNWRVPALMRNQLGIAAVGQSTTTTQASRQLQYAMSPSTMA